MAGISKQEQSFAFIRMNEEQEKAGGHIAVICGLLLDSKGKMLISEIRNGVVSSGRAAYFACTKRSYVSNINFG